MMAVMTPFLSKPTFTWQKRWFMRKSKVSSRVFTQRTGRPVRLLSRGVISWLRRRPQSQ